jgi:hypothetical protein
MDRDPETGIERWQKGYVAQETKYGFNGIIIITLELAERQRFTGCTKCETQVQNLLR